MLCVSIRGAGPGTRKYFKIISSDGPEVSAVEAEVLVRQGHTARLGCVVRGFPASRVSWFKDGNGKYVENSIV